MVAVLVAAVVAGLATNNFTYIRLKHNNWRVGGAAIAATHLRYNQ
jgi:hypothetical protein